ncbi:MAG: YraN family protein [Pseudomonadales bacterium]|nr:YraN family protein [Candidatus Woesebacteria bacterium]MCB9800729.1 YraN family protein [Pseudomonadales bacterium]
MKESEKQLPVLKKRQLTPKQRKNARISYGNRGEELACLFLTERGYTILERNTRLNNYEVDIIALDTKQHELVFVEVKRRRTSAFGHPTHSVGYKKMRSLCRVALTYCQNHGYHFDLRFDIISLVGTNIEHFKNITWLT